jgi:ATP-dependent Lon protease
MYLTTEVIIMVEIDKEHHGEIPEQLPVLPLRNMVVFPGVPTQLLVGREGSLKLVQEVLEKQRLVVVVAQKDAQLEAPEPIDLHAVGVVVYIHRAYKLPDGNMQILARGVQRIGIDEFTQLDPYMVARTHVIEEQLLHSEEELALANNLSQQFQKVVSLVPSLGEELRVTAVNLEKDPGQLADFVASGLDIAFDEKQELLAEPLVNKRLRRLNLLLNRELSILEMGHQIQDQIQEEMGQVQREHYLREQMRVIQKELGEEDSEVEELRLRLRKARLPVEIQKEAEREIERMAHIAEGAAEYTVVRTYLDWLLGLPWSKKSTDRIDIDRARRILDADHKGLEKIKERVLEFLSVRKLKKSSKGPIFCFVGPPGVGKTSLGRSIADSMGRKFARISLGGVRDESEIRGHRRTYVGALPGRIIQALRKAGRNNPVFMLDEIDKLGADFRGDPAAALLEVLDPEQNNTFVDHYLDVPFDLSNITFIATANQLDTIPPALRDRLEIIQLSGYTEDEKVEIVRSHILPRQLKEHGLARRKVSMDDVVLRQLIHGYTREAGLRNLEREVGRLCRKIARQVVEGKRGPFAVSPEQLIHYLGSERVQETTREERSAPGIVAGLAWTPVGGEVMFVEATQMKGGKGLTLTGQLGDVMKESAQIALSYVRSHAAEWRIDRDFFAEQDIHIHLPSGAIPKDGPSGGVAVATALLSLLTGRAVDEGIAMTGEVTLRGRVLPVGGIKEKVLAAHRAGMTKIVLPKRNERDLEDLSAKIHKEIEFVLVDDLSEVFAICLQGVAARRAA